MPSFKTIYWWIRPSIGPFFSGIFYGLGIWLSLQRMLSWLIPDNILLLKILEQAWFIVPSATSLHAAWNSRQRFPSSLISDTDIIVELRVGDMFKREGAFIIGSTTTFDTSMEDHTISEKSIQGQFTLRFAHDVRELDTQLNESLAHVPIQSELPVTSKRFGKRNSYGRGTVCPVILNNRKAYFVSIASLNNNRVAQSTLDELLDALPIMWSQLRERGGMENLVCPILGSGFSRINTPKEKLVQHLIRSFVASSREGKLTEKLSIMIPGSDLNEGKIDLEALRKFLEHECTYQSVAGSHTLQGTPVDTTT